MLKNHHGHIPSLPSLMTAWMQDLSALLEKLSLKPEPFILQPKFWKDEGGGDVPGNCAPLLNRNNACLATEAAANKAILEQTAKWPALCGADKVTSLPVVQPVKGAGTSESILWRDAERTFKTEPYQQQMIKVRATHASINAWISRRDSNANIHAQAYTDMCKCARACTHTHTHTHTHTNI